ncbi:unnamed protein product [Staurois parvus]|uniref:Maturase K n=1 Tax=Staurois parvus TaxID=386267 RepID=A0ABN9G5S4_9NEOB|nr:unnamed protein product [Staurois parvus]
MEKRSMLQYVSNLFIPCLEDLVLSLQIMEVIKNTRWSSFCYGVYAFLHQLI